jgi:hypothetical protein
MNLRRLSRWVIALTVAAGLVSAPLAASFAKPHASVGGDIVVMDAQAMAGEMPCCPDEGIAGDCATCPLMALCMLSTSIPLPAETAALVTRELLREAFAARDDAWVQGLAGHPPDHPPRNDV